MMKRTIRRMTMVMIGVATTGILQAAEFDDEVRQALQSAVRDAQEAMAASPIPKTPPIAVLPLSGDASGRYVEGLLKNAATAAGLNVVEGKTDPMWDEILTEIEWHERKADILDERTLAKFGRLQAAKLLLYGFLREVSRDRSRVFVELEVHVSSIDTKQHIWGGTFAKRYYVPGDLAGLVDLDESLRAALRKVLERGVESLGGAEKLKNVRKVLIVPLAGDVGGYVTGLVKDMFRGSPVNLIDRDIQTLAQARVILRDQPEVADGVLRGSVRDLSRRILTASDLKGTNYEARATVQIDVQTLDGIVWSDTLEARSEYFVAAPHSIVEKLWLWAKARRQYLPHVLGVLVGLVVLGMLFRAARRPR